MLILLCRGNIYMKQKKYLELLRKYFNVIDKEESNIGIKLSYRISNTFSFQNLVINDYSFIIAIVKGTQFNVNEFKYVRDLIRMELSSQVIFYFEKLSMSNKMSLTKTGLGFIVGSNQFFIPELSVLINENYNTLDVNPNEPLTLGTQNILFKILILDTIEIPIKKLGDFIDEKAYEVYRAIKELENKEIINIVNRDSQRTLLLDEKKTIWIKARPLLKSPIIEEVYVDKSSLKEDMSVLVESGVYALSNQGMIISNEVVYAIENKEYKEIKHKLHHSFEGDSNAIKLQVWRSKIVKINRHDINPFALYLSLLNEYDERVKKDYEEYIEKYWR